LEPIDDIANRGCRQFPEHVHDAVLGFGQAPRSFSRHSTTIGSPAVIVN
jgi:hypothetical protein